jgi:serine/threonine-protein kinase
MSLTTGTRLGPYEIVALMGAGGMGEVYRATDTNLKRAVAIKVLPATLAHDAERLARFQREAQVLAALNHPNIAHIHGLEQANGRTALVMELAEGPTLAERLARGALPLDDAIAIAKQIADALEAAHERGIIHRDLKPANIKVRDDGQVKVLDFGLAKAMEPAGAVSATVTQSPTITSPAMTQAGMILGTAAYMSPEQAKGRAVDRRSDVWAFGTVLYEMLTGQRAFPGEDVSDTLAAVLRAEPDWPALPSTLSPTLRVYLQRCLHKDPKQRIPDIGAMRLALAGAFDTSAMPPGAALTVLAPNRPRWRRALPWIATVLVVVAGIAAAASVSRRPAAPARVARFVITTPADAPFQLAGPPGLAMSPDGSRVVFRIHRGAPTPENGVLYLRELGQLDATPIRGTEGAQSYTFFSPDGNWIGFQSATDGSLKRIAVSGGPAQTICPLDSTLRGASWGADGSVVFATDGSKGLRRVPAAGGTPLVLTTVDPTTETDHRNPEVLPDGTGVIFTAWNGSAEQSRIVALSVPSGKVSEVARGGTNPHFSPTGHVVYVIDGALRAVPFSATSLNVKGDPVTVLEGVGGANYALAADGSLVYVKGSAAQGKRTLSWVDRHGRQEAINAPPRAYAYARLSPDGTRVALDIRDQQNDIWIWDLARETLQRLTNDPGVNRGPVWTPDGARLAFTATREGRPENIYWQKADGSGVPERLSVALKGQFPTSFAPDGKRLVTNALDSSQSDLGMLTLEGERREDVLLNTKFNEINGDVSPDGRWLAYQSNESGQFEVYLAPFPDAVASKRQVSAGGGTRPLWSRDGRELFYYLEPGTIMTVPVTPGPNLALGTPTVAVKGPFVRAALTGRHYDVSRDGKRFLLLKDAEAANGAKPAPPEIHLVQHWSEELKRLVPPK